MFINLAQTATDRFNTALALLNGQQNGVLPTDNIVREFADLAHHATHASESARDTYWRMAV